MGVILLVWILNLAISALNAWGCGVSWNESKYVGGIPHFMNWMGAIMAACGFTWCNMVVLAVVGSYIPVEQDDGTTQMLLSGETMQAFCELGYLVIIGPLIGSGLAITVHSWSVFYRRRTIADGLAAGWNTYAQIYNAAHALQNVPDFADHLGSFFKGDDKKGVLVIALVAIAVLGGVVITYLIITRTAARTAMHRSLEGG